MLGLYCAITGSVPRIWNLQRNKGLTAVCPLNVYSTRFGAAFPSNIDTADNRMQRAGRRHVTWKHAAWLIIRGFHFCILLRCAGHLFVWIRRIFFVHRLSLSGINILLTPCLWKPWHDVFGHFPINGKHNYLSARNCSVWWHTVPALRYIISIISVDFPFFIHRPLDR